MANIDDSFPYDEYSDYYENNVDAGFDMFDRLPGSEFLTGEERAEAFELFYEGYVMTGNADQEAREEFLDYMGMTEEDFPWEDWREWMGYE
jgi:hypothetical protein